jgi:hypothetical protein
MDSCLIGHVVEYLYLLKVYIYIYICKCYFSLFFIIKFNTKNDENMNALVNSKFLVRIFTRVALIYFLNRILMKNISVIFISQKAKGLDPKTEENFKVRNN